MHLGQNAATIKAHGATCVAIATRNPSKSGDSNALHSHTVSKSAGNHESNATVDAQLKRTRMTQFAKCGDHHTVSTIRTENQRDYTRSYLERKARMSIQGFPTGNTCVVHKTVISMRNPNHHLAGLTCPSLHSESPMTSPRHL